LKLLAVTICLLLAMSADQIATPILTSSPSAAATSNISLIASLIDNATTTAHTVSYTCQSTSNRLILIVDGNSGAGYTLSDTGGQASGATVIVPNTSAGGDEVQGWNMGCAAGSNSITITTGSSVETFFGISEYSGVQTGADGFAVSTGTATSCSASSTAATAHDLSIAYNGTGTGIASVTSPAGYQWISFGQVGNSGIYPWLTAGNFTGVLEHNLNAAAGTVTFAPTFPSGTSSRCLVVNVPGTTAASPNYYPRLVQANARCEGSGSPFTLAYNNNVVSGDILAFALNNVNASSTPTGISDTVGTTYTLQVHQATGTSNGMWIYTGVAAGSGANTLSVTGSFSFACLTVAEFSGLTGSGTATNTGGQTTSSGTMTWSQTVSNNNSIVFAAVGGFHSSDTVLPLLGVGYSYVNGSDGNDAIAASWSRVLSSGTSTPKFVMSTTDSNVGASIVIQ
jgi:hypothetical protein